MLEQCVLYYLLLQKARGGDDQDEGLHVRLDPVVAGAETKFVQYFVCSLS